MKENENYRKLIRNLTKNHNEKIYFGRNIANVIDRKKSKENTIQSKNNNSIRN